MKNKGFSTNFRTELIDDHDLFKKAISLNNLLSAWSHVWKNGGCAGGDNISLEQFQKGVNDRLVKLSKKLREGKYSPAPLRYVQIPKKDGSKRQLVIPSIVDRVIQTSVNNILTPLLDEEFEDSSFGYRRGKSVEQAVSRISFLQRMGGAWVVDADIEGFFENVLHKKLLERLAQSMSKGPLTELISLWLEHGGTNGKGLAQGSPLSPLLANLYLDRLDEAFAEKGARIVRYADDFVIICEDAPNAQKALEKARNLLAEHDLKINKDKTKIVSFEKGFRFLGHMFVRSLVVKAEEKKEENEILTLMRRINNIDAENLAKQQLAEEELERKRHAGLQPGLRVLYIMEAKRRLSVRNQAFVVEEKIIGFDGDEWREILAIPSREVDRIEVGPKAEVDNCAINLALASDTPLAYVNGWGETLGWVAPRYGARAKRHFLQAKFILDEEKRLELAKAFVNGRVRNQRALLHRLNRARQDKETLKALSQINNLIRNIKHQENIEYLMGLEGRATALYWPAIGRMLKYGFNFSKRDRRGKISGVNIMFNMTANMLARDVTVCLERAGLHPGFGILHETYKDRDALAYDLMEEFRAPLCESVVVSVINSRIVSQHMFATLPTGEKRMMGEAVKGLIRAYERAASRPVKSQISGKRRKWRHIISEQAFLLVAHIEGREQYKPYIMDY